MQPSSLPAGNAPDITLADNALAGNGEIVGQIQDAMAGVVDGHLAANDKTVKSIGLSLRQRLAKAGNYSQAQADNIAGQLGSTIGGVMTDQAATVSSLGAAAVSGGMAPPSPLPGGAGGGSSFAKQSDYWTVWIGTDGKAYLFNLGANDDLNAVESNGYTWCQCNPMPGFTSMQDAMTAAQQYNAGKGGATATGTTTTTTTPISPPPISSPTSPVNTSPINTSPISSPPPISPPPPCATPTLPTVKPGLADNMNAELASGGNGYYIMMRCCPDLQFAGFYFPANSPVSMPGWMPLGTGCFNDLNAVNTFLANNQQLLIVELGISCAATSPPPPPPPPQCFILWTYWNNCKWVFAWLAGGATPPPVAAPNNWIETSESCCLADNTAASQAAFAACQAQAEASWSASNVRTPDPGCTPCPPCPITPCPPCPPCPPPPPPPPQLPADCSITLPQLACRLMPNGKLPQVGSVEWCGCLAELVAFLDATGKAFADLLDRATEPNSDNGMMSAFGSLSDQLLGPLSPILPLTLLKTMAKSQGDDVACFWSALQGAVAQFAVVTSTELLGLTLCRTLLGVLKKLRVGWDLAVWVTVELDVTIEPLERLLDYAEHYAFQWELPSIGEAIDCYLQTTAPVAQVQCWMACQGANFDVYTPVIDARREKLQDAELIQWSRRHDETDEIAVARLQQQGWARIGEAQARVELYDELPTISDHLHWLQRNVFDDAYVAGYDLLNGFADKFWPKFGHDLRALGMREEYAALHYAAHWIIPSVGQLAEMMQRLRPGRVDDGIVFTTDDFTTLLAEQDVAPYYRERLLATAFNTLPLRQLNQATQQGRFDLEELANRFQDIGYTDSDSLMLAQTQMVTAARQKASASHGFTAAVVSSLAEYGLISENDANGYLNPQGFDNLAVADLFRVAKLKKKLAETKRHAEGALNTYATNALKAYEIGAVDRITAKDGLLAAGYGDESAEITLVTADLQVRMDSVKMAIDTVRKAFMLGATDTGGAHNALTIAGVVEPMASTLVERWALAMSVPRVAASTNVILRWARKGIISVQNASVRLANLGWNPGDIDTSLLEVEQSIQQAKAIAAAKTAKALAKAQADAQRVIAKTQGALCKLYSPAKLIRWYKLRIIDDAEFKRRLGQCGTTGDAATDLFREATVAREAEDQKAAKKGTAGVTYTGQGSAP